MPINQNNTPAPSTEPVPEDTFPDFNEIQWVNFGEDIPTKIVKAKRRKVNLQAKLEEGQVCDIYGNIQLENDCYRIGDGAWVLKSDPNLRKEYCRDDEYLLLSHNLDAEYIYSRINENGTFDLDCPDFLSIIIGTPIAELYSKSKQIITIINEEERVLIGTPSLLNDKTFQKYYVEHLSKASFVHISLLANKKYKNYRIIEPKVAGRKYKSGKSFLGYLQHKNIPVTFKNTYGKKYTFGLEIETISGKLPVHLDSSLYYDAVHDGSLRHDDDHTVYGLEYVTDVLVGDQGLKQLALLTNELNKRCLINRKCGVHTHLGGIDFTKENIVLMYWLYQEVQDEIYSMLPASRRNNVYCNKLPKVKIDINVLKQYIYTSSNEYKITIASYYNDIIKVLSKKGTTSSHINKKKDHPDGFKCGYNHSSARYCWVNFIPSVFNTRKNGIYTIEFRPMGASTSYKKIKNWLLVCMGLVDVVVNHKREIIEGKINNLTDIITHTYPNNKEILDYIEERKQKFKDVSISDTEEQNEFSEESFIDLNSIKNL